MNKNWIIIALLFLTSCASSGTKIDPAAVASLREGVTTQQDVLAHFGPPQNSLRLPTGETSLTYGFTAVQVHAESFIPIVGAFVGGADTEHAMVSMLFDQRGILRSYTDSRGGTGSGANFVSVAQARKETGEVKQ